MSMTLSEFSAKNPVICLQNSSIITNAAIESAATNFKENLKTFFMPSLSPLPWS